jgi:hypothetical protein
MKRLLALALAAIIGGPTCMCLAGSAMAPPPPQQHACCHAAHDADGQDAPAKSSPKAPCDCNTCLSKRSLANDAPQVPSNTWTLAPAVALVDGHAFSLHEHTAWSSFLIDSGPPHERKAIFVRHCALLL